MHMSTTIRYGLCMISAMLILAGCNKVENNLGPIPPAKLIGDPSDPNYQMVYTRIAYLQLFGEGMLRDAFDLANEVRTPSGATVFGRLFHRQDALADSAVYDTTAQIWVRAYKDTTIEGIFTYIDSLTFLESSTAVQYPDSAEWTGLVIRSYHAFKSRNTEDSVGAFMRITFTGPEGSLAAGGRVTGSGTGLFRGLDHAGSTAGACEAMYSLTTTISNLAIDLDDFLVQGICPVGGQMAHVGSFAADCEGTDRDFYGTWNAAGVYNAGTMRFDIENQTTRWSDTVGCDELGVPPIETDDAIVQSE